MGSLRRLAIKAIGGRILQSPRRVGGLLARFSATEADSAWQFLRAVELLPDIKQRAQMFETCIEEMHHAALFARLARSRDPSPTGLGSMERTVVLSKYEDLASFLAYAHVSEDDINRDFAALAQVSKDPEIKAVFDSIQADETHHEEGAERLMAEFCKSRREEQRRVYLARLQRGGSNLKIVAGRIGDFLARVFLVMIFVSLGWLLTRTCRKQFFGQMATSNSNDVISSHATAR